MPRINFHRNWCKTCNDWTWHFYPYKEDLRCRDCKTIWSSITYGELPEGKVEEQRERYKQERSRKFKSLLGMCLSLGNSINLDNSNEYEEHDAGQEEIDKKRAEREIALKNKERVERKEYEDKFGKAERNAPCPCGSGKKFKKCCKK